MGRIMILHSKPTLDKQDIEAVVSVLESNHLEEGDHVKELENHFQNYLNINFASAVSTGFASIHLALKALDIKSGDEVILPSYCCAAILNPVLLLGASPVIVDIEPNSFNISVEEVKLNITSKTKAIIAPHIFGFPCKIDELTASGVPVIEDCAQSLGGEYKGKKTGTFGTLSAFSFYATKMICGGDGGLIATQNEELYNRILDFRYYGHKKLHKHVAYNYHLTNLPAALINSQLSKLNFFIERRKQIASVYDECFSNCSNMNIDFENKQDSCFYRYPVMINSNVDDMISKMKEKGIGCGYGVLDGLHQLLELDVKKYPNTDQNLNSIISLPIYPSLTDDEACYVAETLIKLLNCK